MPHIDVIEYENSQGELKEIYDGLIKSRGKIAEVHKIQSLNPKSITDHMELYMTIMFGKSPLKRVQREMIGVVVSKANDCEYCQTHHVEAVNNFWKDDDRSMRLKDDFRKADLNPIDQSLCDYAWKLTKMPGLANEEVLVEPLKELGIDDRTILDATLVIAYFNFVNRIVLSLGVALEIDPGGYKYE